jgi:VanZ family protein
VSNNGELWRWISLWSPVVGFMLLVWFLSGQSDIPAAEYVSDKLLHVVAYAGFGLFSLRACHGGVRPLRRGPTLLAILLAVGYAGVDEWHQSWVQGRFSSVGDWIADVLGVGLAVMLFALLARLPRTGTSFAADPR